MTNPSTHLDRRTLLALGASLGAGAGLSLINGCRTEARDVGSNETTRFAAPNYRPPEEIPGAKISDIEGVSPAYSQYPKAQTRSVSERPGRGGR